MCWLGYITNKRKAMHDIKVYKVLYLYALDENVLMSPRQQFQYTEGLTYNAKITPQTLNGTRVGFIRISYGLHCYSEKCTFTRMHDGAYEPSRKRHFPIHTNLIEKQSDFESGALHVFRKRQFYFPVVFECIIPKGTTYYENKAGEIVTEALTIKKVTDL